MERATDPSAVVEFGRFRLDRHRREFLADGRPVELGGRAFETLLALIEGRGAVLSKDELMRRIWPDRVVEENNLETQISALRKVFGADRDLIRTVARRGYQFTGDPRAPVTVTGAPPAPITRLPTPVSELIGRQTEIRDVMGLIAKHRLVTLTGPGGIGKTRLALEVARRLLPVFPEGVSLAELAPLATPELVPVTVATALDLPLPAQGVSPERIGAAIGANRVLLVLDNCEHLVDAAARIAEAVLFASPGAALLTTSREPLRADGEYVYRVPPLALPPEDADMDDVLRHDAVRLFVTRAHAAEPGFAPDRSTAAAIAAICRRLDGMPLAIELAAARVPSLGAVAIAARLDDRFTLLTSGNRTALPRQQTLRATLDWSYELLSQRERLVLRRLAVFAAAFTLAAATEVASGLGLSAAEVVDTLADLVAKSLVSADVRGPTQYRLLETMRAYALEKLIETGEFDRFARRHAEYHTGICTRVELEWGTSPPPDWMAVCARHIANVRVALDWAFSPGGDSEVGVALTIAAVPLWTHLSLMDECRGRVEQALARLGPAEAGDRRREMQLRAALGAALMYTRGAVPETRAALASVLEIADRLDDTDYRLRALWGLWVDRMNASDVRQARTLAEGFARAAASAADPLAPPVGDRMIGFALHFLGEQALARRHIERMLAGPRPSVHDRRIVRRFQFDPWVTARSGLATILWLQGYPQQAVATARRAVDEAVAANHGVTLCNAFAQGICSVSLLTGDLAAAEHFVTVLLEQSERHGLAFWHADGRCFKGMLMIRRGDTLAGLQQLQATIAELAGTSFHTRYDMFLGAMAEALGGSGRVGEGLDAIDRALDRAKQNGGLRYVAEFLRIKGEILLRADAANAATAAEDLFRQAIELGRRQDALSWELRSATSLARLYHRQGRATQASRALAPIYRRFTEGFDTADLVSAKAVLRRRG